MLFSLEVLVVSPNQIEIQGNMLAKRIFF